MNREEIVQELQILKSAYPNYYSNFSRQDAENLIALWKSVFEEEEVRLVEFVMKQLITTCIFPPTIAQIRETLEKEKKGEGIDTGSAWKQVREAIHCFGYTREEEALAKVHPVVVRVVQSMGWQDLCKSEDLIGDREHFFKLFAEQRGKIMH